MAPKPAITLRRAVLLSVLAAIVLCIPCLDLGYFWDDFYFLTFKANAGDAGAYLTPDRAETFYRPIPLGIYFKLLRLLDPDRGILGHALNLAALLGVVAVLVVLVSRLWGARAGLFSGLLFASYGHVPSLVAWVSGSQDLFAILFVVAAFLCRQRGNDVAALACAAAALMCKETALAAFPLLVLWDRVTGRVAKRPWIHGVGYGLIAAAWAILHPGLRTLVASGFRSTSIGYVGVDESGRWMLYLGRYLLSLLNLPPPDLVPSWPGDRAAYGVVALAIVVVGLSYLDRRRVSGGAMPTWSVTQAVLVGALFVLPAVLMPALLVRHYAPYLACLPAVGSAMLLGPALARRGRLFTTIAIGAFLLLGIWCRGIRGEREPVLSEPAMVEASRAVREVRGNMRGLFPSLPKGSQVVASFGTTGMRGIQTSLVEGQALSLWYRDATLRTTTVSGRRSDPPAEVLVRVTDDLDVLAIDPATMQVRAASGREAPLAEIHRPIHDYARAVAAGGETDRAIGILERLSRIEPAEMELYNRRMIASMLLADGRRAEAEPILAATAPYPLEIAVALVVQLLREPSASESLDAAAIPAFGLSAADPETIRAIMRGLRSQGAMAQAAWYAMKLKRLVPRDPESDAVLDAARRMGITPERRPGRRAETRPSP